MRLALLISFARALSRLVTGIVKCFPLRDLRHFTISTECVSQLHLARVVAFRFPQLWAADDHYNCTGTRSRFASLGELVHEIYRLIWDYNHMRIHSVLKMPPALFAERWQKLVETVS
jgi:hypothetical protein